MSDVDRLTEQELQDIRERCEKASPGPWAWDRSYGLYDGDHWSLHNPEQRDGGIGDGLERTINADLVLLSRSPTGLNGAPLDETPDFQFIAHARSDIPKLLSELSRLRSERVMPSPVDQRPNGCWAACIATITGISLDELAQDFAANAGEAWFDEHGTDLWNDMQRRLKARGWSLFPTYGGIPRGYAIACGTSPRGLYHAVVVKDGQLWHDPHPSRAGLVSIESYEFLMPIVGVMPQVNRSPEFVNAAAEYAISAVKAGKVLTEEETGR